jgi:hypothetical protein
MIVAGFGLAMSAGFFFRIAASLTPATMSGTSASALKVSPRSMAR